MGTGFVGQKKEVPACIARTSLFYSDVLIHLSFGYVNLYFCRWLMDRISAKFPSKTGWQITLTIKFVLPLVNRIYGVWEFSTKGAASSIPQIRDCFDAMLAKNGKIAGVLCDLNVKFAKSDSPLASRFPVVSLVPNETEQNLSKIQALKQIGQ